MDTDRRDSIAPVIVVVAVFLDERCDQAIACVESVLAQRPAPLQVVVVVDHNEPLRARLVARLSGDVEVVPNVGQPELSSARNCGVNLSRGEIIAFVDDEAVAQDGWLGTLFTAFNDPAVIAVGGHAVPAWERGRPPWLPEGFLWVV